MLGGNSTYGFWNPSGSDLTGDPYDFRAHLSRFPPPQWGGDEGLFWCGAEKECGFGPQHLDSWVDRTGSPLHGAEQCEFTPKVGRLVGMRGCMIFSRVPYAFSHIPYAWGFVWNRSVSFAKGGGRVRGSTNEQSGSQVEGVRGSIALAGSWCGRSTTTGNEGSVCERREK